MPKCLLVFGSTIRYFRGRKADASECLKVADPPRADCRMSLGVNRRGAGPKDT
jgi:hypothetical protein